MTVMTLKNLSNLLGFGTFFLLLILKGAFPKPAQALSTLDTCAAKPECAAVLGSELAPAVATPTAQGVSTTITSTTATGTIVNSTTAATGVTVVGDMRLSGIVAYYLWQKGQNEQAQNLAKQRYCAAYPTDSVCAPFKGGQAHTPYYFYIIDEQGIQRGLSVFQYYDISLRVAGPILEITHVGCIHGSNSGNFRGHQYSIKTADGKFTGYSFHVPFFHQCNFLPAYAVRADGQPDTGGNPPPIPWKDWPQVKRSIAVASLTNSDWQGLITSMPEGGRLNPGDTVKTPGNVVIPGQEQDDPNTPADERILKKEPGFFTWPGLPDTDLDGDSVSDTEDPEPQNPNVPVASENPPEPSPEPSPSPSPEPEISISERDTRHIFRDAPGHLPDDTTVNRQLLVDTASNPDNYLGPDRYGTEWYAETRPDGTQVWVRVRNRLIVNGGVNPTPISYNPQTGLNDPPRQ